METVMDFVSNYGIDVLLIAIGITILTGLIKIPIKRCVSKWRNSKKITRFIIFFPIIFGFGLTAIYMSLSQNIFRIDNIFVEKWLSASSLSLAIYAFIEKFLPSEKKIMEEHEIIQNKELIEKIENVFSKSSNAETQELKNDLDVVEAEPFPLDNNKSTKRIVLRSSLNDTFNTK